MADISDLTYNVVACNEILAMLWKRLNDDKNWRHVYKVREGENWREQFPGLRKQILCLPACSDWLNIYSKWSFLWLYYAADHVTWSVAGFFLSAGPLLLLLQCLIMCWQDVPFSFTAMMFLSLLFTYGFCCIIERERCRKRDWVTLYMYLCLLVTHHIELHGPKHPSNTL